MMTTVSIDAVDLSGSLFEGETCVMTPDAGVAPMMLPKGARMALPTGVRMSSETVEAFRQALAKPLAENETLDAELRCAMKVVSEASEMVGEVGGEVGDKAENKGEVRGKRGESRVDRSGRADRFDKGDDSVDRIDRGEVKVAAKPEVKVVDKAEVKPEIVKSEIAKSEIANFEMKSEFSRPEVVGETKIADRAEVRGESRIDSVDRIDRGVMVEVRVADKAELAPEIVKSEIAKSEIAKPEVAPVVIGENKVADKVEVKVVDRPEIVKSEIVNSEIVKAEVRADRIDRFDRADSSEKRVEGEAPVLQAAAFVPVVETPVSAKPTESSVTIAPVDVVRVQAATSTLAPAEVLVQAAEAVADTLLVSPGLLKGQGEVIVQLRPDVLDGTEVRIAVTGRQLEVVFQPLTVDMAVLIENCRPQVVQHLAAKISAFNVSVDVRKKRS